VSSLTIQQVVLDGSDVRALAEFYRELLGLTYREGDEPPPPGEPDPRGSDWLVLRNPGGVQLAFQHVDDLDAEHERATGLGARILLDRSDDDEEPLRVYADPAGHPFCIFVAPPSPED
jgi:hypothetical protein